MLVKKNRNIIERTNYSVFAVSLPTGIRGRELHSAVKNRLKLLYPGKLDDAELVIKKNAKLKNSYLVFVLPKTIPKLPAIIPTLFLQHQLKGKIGTAFYVTRNLIEIVTAEAGAVKASVLKNWNNFSDIKKYLIDYQQDKTILQIFYAGIDIEEFENFFKESNISVKNVSDSISKINLNQISIYSNYAPEKKYLRAVAIFAAAVLIFAAMYAFRQFNKLAEIENEKQREEKIFTEKMLEKKKALNLKAAELEKEYRTIVENKKLKPFDIVNIISLCMEKNTKIISLTIKSNAFQLEAEAANALHVLELFENNAQTADINMQQIIPHNGKEKFSLTGTVLPVVKYLPADLASEEKIKMLETFINKEKSDYENLTESLFGMSLKNLLTSCNCFIDTYQYLGYGNNREIEFAIHGGVKNFFNFLKISSMLPYNCDFVLVQLRNFLPHNKVNAVVRLKIESDFEQNSAQKFLSEKDVKLMEKGIDEILKNYVMESANVKTIVQKEEKPQPIQTAPVKPEYVSWLSYIGAVDDAESCRYLYVKNHSSGAVLKFKEGGDGDMSCSILTSGDIEVVFNNNLYAIRRRE